jgi:hypothetical protein
MLFGLLGRLTSIQPALERVFTLTSRRDRGVPMTKACGMRMLI